MFRKILSLVLVAVFAAPLFSQATEKKDQKEEAAKLQKEAVALLRETMADVANMRTLENRISFSAEMAGLMWFHDEREARGMYAGVIGDFRELLLGYDAQMNSLGSPAEGEDAVYRGFSLGELSDRAQLFRKFLIAMAVRQQIASSLAEHDPDLALSFYYDSGSSISNAELRKQFETRDDYFEFNLIGQIAESNSASAAKLGIKSLEKGLKYGHIDLLRKIYAKDADKGIEFGGKILSKLNSIGNDSINDSVVTGLLNFGFETLENSRKEGGKKPVYSDSELREIAEPLASAMLRTGERFDTGTALRFAGTIEKILPSRAIQIRAKYGSRAETSNNGRISFGTNDVQRSTGAVARATVASQQTENDDTASDKATLENAVGDLGKAALPKEERNKIIAQARKILAQTPGKDKKIVGLSLLASQVSRAGDKELAAEIMRDAESLVNPTPKNYQDFLFTWLLASGYAESDPEKAFPILEDAIGRASDLITSFIRVGEFIDVTGEMISNGEVQVGAFGGGMIRGLTKELGVAESTINTLVKADFAKTKALTNRFDRPEVRVLAKMLVLRSVLGKKAEKLSTAESLELSN